MENHIDFDAGDFNFDEFESELSAELEMEAIRGDLCAQMDLRGIQRLVDTDRDRQNELQIAYLRDLEERETEKFRAQPDGEARYIRGEHHEWVSLASFQALVRQVELQSRAWVHCAKLIYLDRQPKDNESQYRINSLKKTVQAVLLVGLDAEDPTESGLYDFFDEVAPGESLAADSVSARILILSAASAMEQREKGRDKIMSLSKELAGLDEADESTQAAKTTTILMIIMFYSLNQEPLQRAYSVREMGREYDLDDELIEKLVTLYVETIPTLNVMY